MSLGGGKGSPGRHGKVLDAVIYMRLWPVEYENRRAAFHSGFTQGEVGFYCRW